MLNRVKAKFVLHPERLITDTAYGTGPMLGWLVGQKIAPHVPVFDKSGRNDGTWTRADFEWDVANDQHTCPEGHALKQFRRNYSDPNRGPTGKGTARHRALKDVFHACPSIAKCCPNADARKITREEHEDAREDILWGTIPQKQRIKRFQDIVGAHLRPDGYCQSLPRELFENREHLVAPTIAELVVDEVARHCPRTDGGSMARPKRGLDAWAAFG